MKDPATGMKECAKMKLHKRVKGWGKKMKDCEENA